jgi:signal transduction histidine kinase
MRSGCTIRLRDTGTGIAPEHLPHIFEAFFTTKEERHRTGLGLPIAKSILERHGGSIRVESAPNQGTEFVVSIPYRRDQQSQGDK